MEDLLRPLAAFFSGAIVVPTSLFLFFRAMFPVHATGHGDFGFWSAVIIGAACAAFVVWTLKAPLWLALLAGPVSAFTLVILLIIWRLATAA